MTLTRERLVALHGRDSIAVSTLQPGLDARTGAPGATTWCSARPCARPSIARSCWRASSPAAAGPSSPCACTWRPSTRASTGEAHRWHHSRRLEDAEANYGNVLLLWDAFFGTLRIPEGREPPEDVGLSGAPDFPRSLGGQLLAPLRSALWVRRD